MRYNELTIFSDLDGTLFESGSFEVPEKNRLAVRSFIADGGRFAIATGRTPDWTRPIVEQLGVNFPCVLYNGGVVYDFADESFIVKEFLPDAAREYVGEIAHAAPWVGIVPISENFNVDDEVLMVQHIRDGKPVYKTDWQANREPWFKVLFGVTPGRGDELIELVRGFDMPGIRILQTNDCLIEMLPAGASKGSAIEKIYGLLGLEREKTVAIGDFYNDYEMIRAAGIGVCVLGAPPELINASKYVTCPCGDGAVADLIERLKRDYP
jgi:hypothetical protein